MVYLPALKYKTKLRLLSIVLPQTDWTSKHVPNQQPVVLYTGKPISRMLHVWYIYLHDWMLIRANVTMEHMGMNGKITMGNYHSIHFYTYIYI